MTNFDDDDLEGKSSYELLRMTGGMVENALAQACEKVRHLIKKGMLPHDALSKVVDELEKDGLDRRKMRIWIIDRLLGVYKN